MSVLPLLIVLAMSAITLATRFVFFGWRSPDYAICLEHWLEHVREMPGVTSLAANIGDYNAPYFYILFCIGKLTTVELQMFYLKMVSIAFDILLAYYVMRLVRVKRSARPIVGTIAFFITLLLPTVILNSACWAQCDSVYAALTLGGVYYGIEKRGKMCLAMFALALAFKLQTIFLFPLLLALLLLGNVRWKDIWVFFAVFAATIAPAVLCGRGVLDTLSIYIKQTGSYSAATMNAPTIFGLLSLLSINPMIKFATILFAGALCLGMVGILVVKRERVKRATLLSVAYWFALTVPFFLPYMHERYFYVADILATVYVFANPRRWYLLPLTVIASLLCYLPFLMGADYSMPFQLSVLSTVILGMIGMTTYDVLIELGGESLSKMDCRLLS